MSDGALLRELREQDIAVEADGDTLRVRGPRNVLTPPMCEKLRTRKPDLVAELRREAVEELLDLVPVDPKTGLPDLPTGEPATTRQVDRLRELADHHALAPHRDRVHEIVEDAIQAGLSQLGAYGLLGKLGRRIAHRREDRPSSPEPTRCDACSRRIGPASSVCGACRGDER